jgi:hypothetical protein
MEFEFECKDFSWSRACRLGHCVGYGRHILIKRIDDVLLKAEVMALGENRRFVVTSLGLLRAWSIRILHQSPQDRPGRVDGLHLPSACAVKDLLHTLAELLLMSAPAHTVNTS